MIRLAVLLRRRAMALRIRPTFDGTPPIYMCVLLWSQAENWRVFWIALT